MAEIVNHGSKFLFGVCVWVVADVREIQRWLLGAIWLAQHRRPFFGFTGLAEGVNCGLKFVLCGGGLAGPPDGGQDVVGTQRLEEIRRADTVFRGKERPGVGGFAPTLDEVLGILFDMQVGGSIQKFTYGIEERVEELQRDDARHARVEPEATITTLTQQISDSQDTGVQDVLRFVLVFCWQRPLREAIKPCLVETGELIKMHIKSHIASRID